MKRAFVCITARAWSGLARSQALIAPAFSSASGSAPRARSVAPIAVYACPLSAA
jgi:hypothetical protein